MTKLWTQSVIGRNWQGIPGACTLSWSALGARSPGCFCEKMPQSLLHKHRREHPPRFPKGKSIGEVGKYLPLHHSQCWCKHFVHKDSPATEALFYPIQEPPTVDRQDTTLLQSQRCTLILLMDNKCIKFFTQTAPLLQWASVPDTSMFSKV